jgi:hypothetical protein
MTFARKVVATSTRVRVLFNNCDVQTMLSKMRRGGNSAYPGTDN